MRLIKEAHGVHHMRMYMIVVSVENLVLVGEAMIEIIDMVLMKEGVQDMIKTRGVLLDQR